MEKSRKINEVINKYGYTLNLHEIKAKTGAGNGHRHTIVNVDNDISNNSPKLEKLYEIITNTKGSVNLHKIKAQTGVGNGYKHIDKVNMSTTINNDTDKTYTHKSHKINDLIINTSKKLNLHEIKAQTGAGSGYKH